MMRRRKWMIAIILISLLVILFVACNRSLDTHAYTIDADTIETPVKFAIITDLHSTKYGDNMEDLVNAVKQAQPDAVLLVGDIFDHHHNNNPSWTLITQLSQLFPCYYTTGNHELVHPELDSILEHLNELGVHTLAGTSDTIVIHNQSIRICGIDDMKSETALSQLHAVTTEHTSAQYHILLSHRPENTELYAESGADIVISGHAHGGQWRVPLLFPNGLYAPNQGLFPKYTGGLYQFDTWNLLVSRGLDKQSVKYPRIFNRPELVILTVT